MTRTLCFLLIIFANILAHSQDPNKTFTVKFVPEFLEIDGILDDPAWESAEGAKDFQQYFPSEKVLAEQPTEIKMVYNGTILYVGLKVSSVGNNAELAIPLTSLKFREGETQWRLQSYRFDMQTNERSVWNHVPQNQSIFSLAFMGDMVFEKPLGKSRTPLALIPYINTIAEKDFSIDESSTNFKIGVMPR